VERAGLPFRGSIRLFRMSSNLLAALLITPLLYSDLF